MRMELANKTDVGRRRENNEDYFASYENQRWLFVLLSDGMGGFEGGETASLITIKTLHREFEQDILDPFLFLKNSISSANQAVQRAASNNDELGGMGATVVALLYDKSNHVVYYAHVGDSRIYLFRKNRLMRLTEDHSEVREMVAQGIISEEEAKSHKRRHVITRCIGRETGVAEVCKQPLAVQDDDQFLLCSDGLTDMLGDEDLTKILKRSSSPQEKVDLFVAMANDRGGKDNITVQLLHLSGTAVRTGFAFRKTIAVLAAVLVLICVAIVLYRTPWSAKLPRATVKKVLRIPAGVTAVPGQAQDSLDSASAGQKVLKEPIAAPGLNTVNTRPEISKQPLTEDEQEISSEQTRETVTKNGKARSSKVEQKGEVQWLAPIDDPTAYFPRDQNSVRMNAETGGAREEQTPPVAPATTLDSGSPVESPDAGAARDAVKSEAGAQLPQGENKKENAASLERTPTSIPSPSKTTEKAPSQEPVKKEVTPAP